MVQRGLSGADGAATARNERRDPSGSRLCHIPEGAASKGPWACSTRHITRQPSARALTHHVAVLTQQVADWTH